MTQEHRRHKRYEVEEVHGTLARNLDARVLNVSLTGMAIETRNLLRVGGDYHLKIVQDGEPLRVEADVRWCHLVRTEKSDTGDHVSVYKAGIDFRSILDEKALQMLKFIEDNVVVELDQRLFGRFRFASDESVDIDQDERFAVRKISLSGMLIETEFRPPLEAGFGVVVHFDSTRIEARVRIAHVEPIEEEADRFRVGAEFLDLSDADRRAIEKLIEGVLE